MAQEARRKTIGLLLEIFHVDGLLVRCFEKLGMGKI
jgi:hypothetical protein